MAEVISERTESFHSFWSQIGEPDKLLYSEYFYSFRTCKEHNEAVSHIKLGRYKEAVTLLESLFSAQDKLLTISSVHVLQCLCELVADHRASLSSYCTVFSIKPQTFRLPWCNCREYLQLQTHSKPFYWQDTEATR